MSKQGAVFFVVAGLLITGLVARVFVTLNQSDTHAPKQNFSVSNTPNSEPATSHQTLPASLPQNPLPTPESSTEGLLTSPRALPAEVNWAVPFTSQAPFGHWEAPFKEFCEEASTLMVAHYFQHESIATPEAAAAGLLDIQAFEQKEFGYWEDTTASEVAVILKKHFGIQDVHILANPTAEDLKEALAAGKLIILPAAGRLLGNPYFTPPGPLYHMLVIKGYTKSGQFITNDPGTRRGADFMYEPATLLNALHDWRSDGNIEQGQKVLLVVG